MIGKKVKQWLGIEGVKITVDVPFEIAANSGVVEGVIRLESMHPQVVTRIRLALVERYARGRGKDRLVDEYLLGELIIDEEIPVDPDEPVEMEFALPFAAVHSPVDELEKKNVLARPVVRLAKWLNKVESSYRIEAEAAVEGTVLNPVFRKEVRLK